MAKRKNQLKITCGHMSAFKKTGGLSMIGEEKFNLA
jgi:hypothetical protein